MRLARVTRWYDVDPGALRAPPGGTMDREGMYGARAELYDALYASKDYAGEAARIVDWLEREGVPAGSRVLELACGSGNHLVHLQHTFRVQGLDLNAGMVARAERKLPGVPIHQGDMASFTVDPPVDAVLSLFSGIGYVEPARLPAVFGCVRDALRPGGVALIEPWLPPDRIRDRRPYLDTLEEPDRKIARACTTIQDGRASRLAFHWLVATPDGVEHFVDEHTLWCSTIDELLQHAREAGLAARFDEVGLDTGRGLLIVTRP